MNIYNQTEEHTAVGCDQNGYTNKRGIWSVAKYFLSVLFDQDSKREIAKMPDWLLHDIGLTRTGLRIGPDGLPISDISEGDGK